MSLSLVFLPPVSRWRCFCVLTDRFFSSLPVLCWNSCPVSDYTQIRSRFSEFPQLPLLSKLFTFSSLQERTSGYAGRPEFSRKFGYQATSASFSSPCCQFR